MHLLVQPAVHQNLGIRFFFLSVRRRYVSSDRREKEPATPSVLSPLRALICIPNYPLANTSSRVRDMLLQSNESPPRISRVHPFPINIGSLSALAGTRWDLRGNDELRIFISKFFRNETFSVNRETTIVLEQKSSRMRRALLSEYDIQIDV